MGHLSTPTIRLVLYAEAASYLFEEFYRQGVMTSEFFLDDKKFLRGIEGKPDPERMKNFRRRVGHKPASLPRSPLEGQARR